MEKTIKSKSSNNKCSKCNKEGHNRRTCKKKPQILAQKTNKIQVQENKPSLQHIDREESVKRLTEHLALTYIGHEDLIMKCNTLKEAHIYCIIYCISSQKYGLFLEKFIRIKFNYIKNKTQDTSGDCFKDGKNLEVKVSLGGETHRKFNFVQIRPSHQCDYILTAYHLSSENVSLEGELYIFKVSKSNIQKIIVSYGGYAHGTIKEHGVITIDSFNNKKTPIEYAIRPTINDDCWKALMEFRVYETDL